MKKHIAIVATIGAGKTTAAKYFESKGFVYYRLSQAIYFEIERIGKDFKDRNLLRLVGDGLRAKYGPGVLAKKAIEYFKKFPGKNYVIDSIRNHHEILELKREFGDALLIISIDAPLKLRYKRVIERDEYNEKYTYQEFVKLNRIDLGVGNTENGQNNQKCIDMSELRIVNDGSLEEFYKKLDLVYEKYFTK